MSLIRAIFEAALKALSLTYVKAKGLFKLQ